VPARSERATTGVGRPAAPLPAKPVVTIAPSRSWVGLDLRDVWHYRELLYFLAWRDVKVRYKQTVLGAAWAILQPVLTMVVFTLLFGTLAGIASDGVAYPVFAYSGLVLWTFFANAVASSGNSLVGNANLITKTYFPRMIIPAAAVGAGLIDMALALSMLVALLGYYGIPPAATVAMVPVLVLLVALLALGVGMGLSAVNVRYRDIRLVVPFILQIWMFVSPVIYPASLVPAPWRWVLVVNPLTGIIENFRIALFGGRSFDWTALAASAAITLLALVGSAYFFRRTERSFADVV
jgi:lipopolysaccharide transport system permease protein